MSSRQTLEAASLPARAPEGPPKGAGSVAEVRSLATRSSSPLTQSRAEAWAVVHCAERLGYRDIGDALHQAIENAADENNTDEVVRSLDAARDYALARLDACGALAGDSEAL